jgi:DinB family protein
MPHPLVLQLRFTRSEFKRSLKGVADADARRRILPMNCISWNVGHLGWQEQEYFLWLGEGRMLLPDVRKRFAYGAPPSEPPLAEMLAAWSQITTAADPWLDEFTSERLAEKHPRGKNDQYTFGNRMQRVIYHYWYHTGENMAIRQMLGHARLPTYVGNIDDTAPYRPE